MPDDQESEDREREEHEEHRRRRGDDEADQREAETAGSGGEATKTAGEMADSGGKEGQDVVEYTQDAVDIPRVELEDKETVAGSEIDTSEPDVVQTPKREVRIPDVELATPEADTSDIAIEIEEPEIEIMSEEQDVPVVQLDAVSEVRMQVTSFDTEIRESEQRRRQRVHVPLYRAMSEPWVRTGVELDTTIQPEVYQRIEQRQASEEPAEMPIEERDQTEIEVSVEGGENETRPISDGPELTGGRDSVDATELPDPFELIFSSSGGVITVDKPLVIGLDDEEGTHIGVLRTLCKRIYREKKGGKPDPLIIRDLEELTGGERGKGEIRWLEAEDQIFSMQLDAEEWEELVTELDREWERIWNRIDQLFAQNFGVIIFNNPVQQIPTEHLPTVVHLEPRPLDPPLQRAIARLCWGFIDVGEAPNFNMVFSYAQDRSKQRLKEMGQAEGGIFRDATQEHDGPESDLHLQMKWFIVRYLTHQLRDQGVELETPTQIEEVILTEVPVTAGTRSDSPTADVKRGSDVFEIETLFAQDQEGSDPRNKLRESFKKYENTTVDAVHIVLDNLTFYRHLQDIIQLKRNHRDWEDQHGIEVRFETLDLQENDLIGIDEAIARLKLVTEQIS